MVLGLSERWGPHTLLPSLACLRQEEAGESCGFQTLPQNPQGPFGGRPVGGQVVWPLPPPRAASFSGFTYQGSE